MKKLKTQKEVYDYLKSKGYDVSQATLSRKWHLLDKLHDGSCTTKDADEFARLYLRQKLSEKTLRELQLEKAEAEARKLRAEAEKRELEVVRLRGEVMPKWEVEQQLAARIVFLKDSLKNFAHSAMPKIAEVLEGNMELIPDAIELMLDEIDNLFDYYSRPITFEVNLSEDAEFFSDSEE